MIKNIIFGVYQLNSDFLLESLKANKNWQKNHSFYHTVSLKKLHSFYEPQLTQHYKKYTPATLPKTCFWLVSEKLFAQHHFKTSKNCILGALGKQISLYSCKSPFENFCSRDVGSFYLEGG